MANEQQALLDAVAQLAAAEQQEETSIAAALADLTDIAAELQALQAGGGVIDPKVIAVATQDVNDVIGRLTSTRQNIAAVVAANPDPGPQPPQGNTQGAGASQGTQTVPAPSGGQSPTQS